MSGISLDEAKQKVSTIRASLDRECASIRNNPRYSEQGRRQELAKAVLIHRKQAEGLRANFSADNERTRAKLVGRLFGLPAGSDAATTLVYRDALDRAAKIEGVDDASAALKRALEMGDTLLARAIAGHAHSNKWRSVTADYAETAGLSDYLDDLEALPSGGLLKTATNALFRVPTPPELSRAIGGDVPDAQLKRIADGEVLP